MAQAGYTPISLYFSTTAAAVPTSVNLANGELAINIQDEKLYFKNAAGTVKLLASNATSAPVLSFSAGTTGLTPNTATTGAVTLAGTLAVANGGTGVTTSTGTTNVVLSNNPVLVAPTLGVATATSLQGIIGNVTPAAGSFTTLGASSTATLNTLSSSGATLTGGTINGMTVGATTASSGAFTTVTASTAIGTASGGTGLSSFTSGGVVYASSTSALATGSAFQFNGTDLGLGVTPSVNTVSGSGYRQIEVGTSVGNMVFAGGNELLVVQNAIYNSGFKYAQSTQASYFRLNAGGHQFFTAASGTAGNAISFTQAMTLDASGNLGVGETSPSNPIHVKRTSGASIIKTQATDTASYASVDAQSNSGSGTLYRFGSTYSTSGQYVASSTLLESSAGPLSISSTNAELRLYTSNTERARIDSSGNLLVGTTTATAKLTVDASTGDMLNLTTSGTSSGYVYTSASTTTSNAAFFIKNSSGVGSISCSSVATAYNTSSDYRLKNSVAPMTGALAKVAQLKPVTYKWNADGSDGEGFIAHELAEVCPHAVTGEKDAVDDEGNPKYQGIDTSFLVATVVAALQELKAEFDAYKASRP